MAIENGYCTLADLKTRFDVLDSTDDTILEQNIEAASRQIDGMCGRHFYQEEATTHYYAAEDWNQADVDDLVSVTTLSTDEDGDRVYETVWGATDFELGPGDAAPYTRIYVTPNGMYAFPFERKSIQVVGVFGWSEVPHAIREATLLLAARLFKRKDSPMGAQIGNQQLGALSIPGKDPDVERLLAPYRKFALVAV